MHTQNQVLAKIIYGSRLFGTSTATSDFDYKAVVLPGLDRLMLGKKTSVLTERFTAEHERVPAGESMSANGYETEFTPIQKFVADYLSGQAYAVEFVYAMRCNISKPTDIGSTEYRWYTWFQQFCIVLSDSFKHKNVTGMVGFALKQTLDFVKRGERLNAAQAVMGRLQRLMLLVPSTGKLPRLDDLLPESMQAAAGHGSKYLDYVAGSNALIGEAQNNNSVMRTLEINGRAYCETTTLEHFRTALQKLIDSYGDRSTAASKTDIDWKSLSHAVRVYQQIIELLNTGYITFPRPNAAQLLDIRLGNIDREIVKELLRSLDAEVLLLRETSTLAEVTPEFIEQAEAELLYWLKLVY